MKNNKLIRILLIVCVAALCAAVFTGCSSALTIPEDLHYQAGTFMWKAVEGADGYMVRANEASEFFVDKAFVSATDSNLKNDLVDKEFNTLYVRAVSLKENGDVDKSSEAAEYGFDFAFFAATEWKVNFDLNYTGSPKAQTVNVKNGEKFNKPADPKRVGMVFDGWFKEKLCLTKVEFSADGKSDFAVTANTTVYAKWKVDSAVTTTSIYFYAEEALKLTVKPYNGSNALFEGAGIEMSVVAGKANWYKADIDENATNVIFVNGGEAGESLVLDKTKPYLKDGVWTALMPVEPPVEIKHEVFITVGDNEPQQLTENPKVAGEYEIVLDLEVDDTVVITIDGQKANNYDTHCNFTGTVKAQGSHAFYVSTDRIWVTAPEVIGENGAVYLIVNGNAEKAYKGKLNLSPMDERVDYEYEIAIRLREGATVQIIQGDFEYTKYENASAFNGTAKQDGKYTFYVKTYKNGDRSVWVSAPKHVSTEVTTTPTKVYFHNTVGFSAVYLYCWVENGPTNKAWPGVRMEQVEGDEEWYVLEIGAGYAMIIFNNGSGGTGNQTDDLDLIVADGYAYYDFYGVTEERPNLEPEETEQPELPEQPEQSETDTEQTQGV